MDSALRLIQLRLIIQNQLDTRETAKADKDFEKADAIRATLAGQGITINDQPSGLTWTLGNGTYGSITCLEDLKLVVETEIELQALWDEIKAGREAYNKKHDRPSTPPDYEVGE